MQSLQEKDNGQRTATQDQGSKETQEAACTRQSELTLLANTAPALPGQYNPDMPRKPDEARLDRIVAEARKLSTEREATYRGRALKLFPWICGRCGREFSGARLRELTVHHKDHDHDNNPEDGSNWELLCLYCHDNEHMRLLEQQSRPEGTGNQTSAATHNPFANLKKLLKEED